MRARSALSCFLISAALLCAIAAFSQGPATETVRLLTLLGKPLPLVVGEMHGTFAKHGIDVRNQNFPNSDGLRAALAAGQGDVAYVAVDNAVAMVELTHADVAIVSGGEGSQNELIVQPSINSFNDLRGKTLIVDATYTAYALQMKKILLLNGLQPGRDYEMKAFGVTPKRLIAMRENKEFAGSMLGPPTSLLAKREGFKSLGSVQQIIGPYQAAGSVVQRKWALEHRAALVNYLAAYIEAQRWLMDPANKQQVLDLMVKQSHLTPDVAAETYDLSMNHPGGYEKDARFDIDGFKNVLKLRADIEGSWGGHPPAPDKYYDPAYYDAALAKLKESK